MDPTATRPLNMRKPTPLGRAILAVQSIPHADLDAIDATGGNLDAEERAARAIVGAYLEREPDDLGPVDG